MREQIVYSFLFRSNSSFAGGPASAFAALEGLEVVSQCFKHFLCLQFAGCERISADLGIQGSSRVQVASSALEHPKSLDYSSFRVLQFKGFCRKPYCRYNYPSHLDSVGIFLQTPTFQKVQAQSCWKSFLLFMGGFRMVTPSPSQAPKLGPYYIPEWIANLNFMTSNTCVR